MVLNYIWIGFFVVAFFICLIKFVFTGQYDVFYTMFEELSKMTDTAVTLSLGMIGVLAFWLGMMKIAERGGLVNALSRLLSPVFVKLFPSIPKGHPAMGSIFMNMSANMLGLDNSATPMGLKAMKELDDLKNEDIEKQRKEKNLSDAEVTRLRQTATDPMIMFLVLNTSGVTLIPVSVLAQRSAMNAAQPTDVFIPILLATFCSTMVGLIVTSLYQRINLLNRTLLMVLGGMCFLMAAVVWGINQLDPDSVDLVSNSATGFILMAIIVSFISVGLFKRINVYDAFVEGAKEGFTTAVRIIPYLLAILAGIAVFKASGAMQWIIDGIAWVVGALGFNTDFVGALPTAMMKPLSGGGARGMMVDAMETYGPDSFVGHLACIFQGSTETTFYILAVYFGSVSIRYTRHAVTCGLLADLAGIIAAIFIAYMFFG
ncbi:MAG: spore maturation protein [Prevotella sp.]|nr:spore maturation protein [Prevotella sp.]